MRNLLAAASGAAVISAFTFSANAADLIIAPPSLEPIATYAAPADPFTGFYIGGTAGLFTSDDFDDEAENGWALGGQIGYTKQFGMFVLGAEAEALWLDDLNYQFGLGAGVTQDWEVSAKLRAGVALDHTLLYGTLGYAITDFDGFGGVVTDDDLVGGVQWGLGVEQAFNDTISARVEYAHTYYDDVGGTDIESQAVKAGVNFRF